jgi:RHS repeat-associated protein
MASGHSFYYYFDGLGSVIGLMDGAGNQRASYSYDPFGAHATATAVNGALPANPWRWMGSYLDASTGLYHFGERYYVPARGRFLQPGSGDGWELQCV